MYTNEDDFQIRYEMITRDFPVPPSEEEESDDEEDAAEGDEE